MTQIKYIHIHVPKNGGSTFNAILARHFGAQNMSNYKFSPGQIFSEDEKRNCLAAYPDCACINGHVFRFPGPVLPDTEYRYLTFLRQPIARLMSLYAYERKTSDPSHCSHRFKRGQLCDRRWISGLQRRRRRGGGKSDQPLSSSSSPQNCQRARRCA